MSVKIKRGLKRSGYVTSERNKGRSWLESNVSQNFVEHRLKRFWSMVCVDSVEDYGTVRF